MPLSIYLGFKSLIDSLPGQTELHFRLNKALKEIKEIREDSLIKNTAQSDLEVNQFSDSIAISSNPTEDGLWGIVWTAGWLQANLLYLGILTRGGIAIGPTVHEDDLIYGEGMIEAHNIESTVANFPRIVIDPKVFSCLDVKDNRRFVCKEDFDGMWFIDPFEFNAFGPDAEGLAADGYDPREIYFNKVLEFIELELTNPKKLEHAFKWEWMKNKI